MSGRLTRGLGSVTCTGVRVPAMLAVAGAGRLLTRHSTCRILNKRMFCASRCSSSSMSGPESAKTGDIFLDKEYLNAMSFDGQGIGSVTRSHWTSQEIPARDFIMPPSSYLQFCLGIRVGRLPNGKLYTQRLPSLEEINIFKEPRDLISSSRGEDVQGASRRWAVNVLAFMLNENDPKRNCLVGRNIKSLKMRLWHGVPLMSERRWSQKGLDDPANFDIACEHLSSVIAAFEYLNHPRIRGEILATADFIARELGHMADPTARELLFGNKRRAIFKTLWREFLSAQNDVMTASAYHFVHTHVQQLQAILMEEMMNSYGNTLKLSSFKYRAEKLVKIAAAADVTIRAQLTRSDPFGSGVSSIISSLRHMAIPSLKSSRFDIRGGLYAQRVRRATAEEVRTKLAAEKRRMAGDYGAVQLVCHWMSLQMTIQDRLRLELVPVPEKPISPAWVAWRLPTSVGPGIDPRNRVESDLAIYRLTYDIPDREWNKFVWRLEKDMYSCFDEYRDIKDRHEIKSRLSLQWFNGRTLGIKEGDVKSAIKHFRDVRGQDSDLVGGVFLAVDRSTFESYMNPNYEDRGKDLLPGDFGPNVLAVEPDWSPDDPEWNNDESPWYNGQMRILGSLVWSDLYAMTDSTYVRLRDLWADAIDHPHNIYTGPTVPLQIWKWREIKERETKQQRIKRS